MTDFDFKYDVIVIGGGHAGCEAAHAAARFGVRTLLLTHNIDTIGQMSCNPAIGGLGKGHLVREVDALGGLIGQIADLAGIQFRLLNRRKGPAVQGPRAQIDRLTYKREMLLALQKTPNLQIRQAAVTGLTGDAKGITGVNTDWGETIGCTAIVLTTGTFLDGLGHIGHKTFKAGRLGDPPSAKLAKNLRSFDLPIGRLKTGTPPRLDGNTIQWEILEEQFGDKNPVPFSFMSGSIERNQLPCHITHTNEKSHQIIQNNLERSAMYGGKISGVGPRYCPSIEDKIVRFKEKNSHQIFLEPEGRHTHEIYPNGISTSLPIDVQWQFLRSIKGLEKVEILRPAYAIEYDMVNPQALNAHLQVKATEGLFLAGQINGTTGYEEAAAQGLIAGLNAAKFSQKENLVSLGRDEAYIGVMIDDLITKGVDEPYRMFTSRAEFRLLLRAGNADRRLTPKGKEWGAVNEERWNAFQNKENLYTTSHKRLQKELVNKNTGKPQEKISANETGRHSAWDALRITGVIAEQIFSEVDLNALPDEIKEELAIEAQYSGYLKKQRDDAVRHRKSEDVYLSPSMDWKAIHGLSAEIQGRLEKAQPRTLGEASRLPGITPVALSAILIHLKKNGAKGCDLT